MKQIVFSLHAEAKFQALAEQDFRITRTEVEQVLISPDEIMPGYRSRKIAQRAIDEEHVLRVVFEEFGDRIKIITFYPARRNRYENSV